MSIMEDVITRKVNADKASNADRLAAENASLKHGLAGLMAKEGWMSTGKYDSNGEYYRHPEDGNYNNALNYMRSINSGAVSKNQYDPAVDYMDSEPDVSRDYPRAKEYTDEVNQAAIADMIAKNRAYQGNRRAAEFTTHPRNTGRYELDAYNASNDGEFGPDPISNAVGDVGTYLRNIPKNRANEYVDNVDRGLAAMWQSSYK